MTQGLAGAGASTMMRILLLTTVLGFNATCESHAQDVTGAEVEFWQSVKDSKDVAELEAYLKAYRDGRFTELARLRLRKLEVMTDSITAHGNDPVRKRAMTHFTEALDRIQSSYVIKPDATELIEAAITGMVVSLDAHSTYYAPKIFNKLGSNRELGGIGLELTMEGGVIVVVAPLDGTPASTAGIQSTDLITHLNGQSLVGRGLEQVMDMMRGPINSTVILTLVRKGKEAPFDISLARQAISSTSVLARAVGVVAYIRISTFNEETHASLIEAVALIKGKLGDSLKGYVIDLRNNGGGSFDQAVLVADDFLDRGVIAIIKGRDDVEIQRSEATAGDIANEKQIIVLINHGTAGSAEIVAGALQDNKRATVIGTRSYGLGTVHTVFALKPEGAIKIATTSYYTPSGRRVRAKGIEPDTIVPQVLPAELQNQDIGAFVPRDSEKDAQLQLALRMILKRTR